MNNGDREEDRTCNQEAPRGGLDADDDVRQPRREKPHSQDYPVHKNLIDVFERE